MSNVSDPGKYAVAISPSNTVDLPAPTRAIYVGSAGGNLVAVMNGVPITFTAVPAGILPIQCTRVNLTGTTATNLVALW
jgi:hypothetical protein